MAKRKGVKVECTEGKEKDWVEEFVEDGIPMHRSKDGIAYPAWLDVDQKQFSKLDGSKKKG
jgi:hypothetical protein